MKRSLGNSSIEVSAIGLGCWAIGGRFTLDGKEDGWGAIDDAESIRAIKRAIDLGAGFFDTADVYGAGHSEEVLGKAIKGRRDKIVIATKFGYLFDENTKQAGGIDVSPDYIERACAASLRRLGTSYIDLYQIHAWSFPDNLRESVIETLDRLVAAGKIRAYGWSTDQTEAAKEFARMSRCVSIEYNLNILEDNPAMLEMTGSENLASLCRGPLAMGLLTGKFAPDAQLPRDDVRGAGHDWVGGFISGKPRPEYLKKLQAVRDVLTSGGRSLSQGSLCWLLARGKNTIPIPGFKNAGQVEENLGAMSHGPLDAAAMEQIAGILSH